MKNFEQALELARSKGRKTVSVACAQDRDVLLAVDKAREAGIVDAILVGDEKKIREIAAANSVDLNNYRVVDREDLTEAAREAVRLVSSGEAHMLMKGLVDTSIVLKAVLDKEIGLRGDSILSHVAVFEIEGWDRLFYVTDAAMNIAPNLDAKKKIIENAVKVARSLEVETPKVACLCAKEKVNEKMPDTVDAKALEDMNKNGELKDCLVGGPFALDNAISEEAAKHKGMDHPVAGRADILMTGDIEAGNVLYKSMAFFAKSKNAGIIVGARKPIILTSRADNEEAKLNSIILGSLTADKL
ncbi:phosphate butyryltransferase [Propionigenium maris DSM 9537]|uniref:Phosphate butyryltransferase n=1 Tax=Propionigenium maris DSM 9537 TaxID=1123000 RepID=A0A9W6LM52_9FUSO|nr:phosphate butyryltransferase [Propionigenium maris]GLI54545.1 phosphate butyryltransferase [Propionigenium maris DSM 9537]